MSLRAAWVAPARQAAYPGEVGRGIACSGSRQASGQIEAGALQVALGAACVDGSVAIELQVVRRDPEFAQRDPGGSLDGGPQCSTRVIPPIHLATYCPLRHVAFGVCGDLQRTCCVQGSFAGEHLREK